MLRVGRGKCLLCKLVFLQFSSQTVGCRQYMEPRLLTNAVHPTTPSTTNTPKLYTAEQLRHFIFPTKVGKRSKSYKKSANNVWLIPMEEFMVFEDFWQSLYSAVQCTLGLLICPGELTWESGWVSDVLIFERLVTFSTMYQSDMTWPTKKQRQLFDLTIGQWPTKRKDNAKDKNMCKVNCIVIIIS